MQDTVNILLLGKTGVGKSSFINYFVGDDVAEAGVGAPVTQDYFDTHEVDAGRCHIKIYDTKGIESLDARNQTDQIVNAVRERGSSENMTDWFHTIFYVVSMANPRFEDFEADFVRRLREQTGQRVHVVLTHCDTHPQEQIDAMRATILSKTGATEGPDGVQFFPVTSVEKRKRSGAVIERTGRDEVVDKVLDLFMDDIAFKMSMLYAQMLRRSLLGAVDDAFVKIDAFIDQHVKAGTFFDFMKDGDSAKEHFYGLIRDTYNDIMESLDANRKRTDEEFAELLAPISSLYVAYRGAITGSYVEAAALKFDDTAQWMDVEGLLRGMDKEALICKVLPRVGPRVVESLKSGASVGAVFKSAVGGSAADLFSIKKHLKEAVADVKKQCVAIVPTESEIQKRVQARILESLGQK